MRKYSAAIAMLLMESIEGLKLLQSQEFISDAEKLLAEAEEMDLSEEPQALGEASCNPCYNSSLHPNNNWGPTKANPYVAKGVQNGYTAVPGNPVWARAQGRITNDKEIEARNKALGGVAYAQAEEGVEAEQGAEEGCNPCYNSSVHNNNNWASGGKNVYKSTGVYNGYTPLPGPPVWAKAQARITSDADVKARNVALGGNAMAQTEQEPVGLAEEGAEEGCNPCYNSSVHNNNNWASGGKNIYKSTGVYNGYTPLPGPPVWAKAQARITNDNDVKARNIALGGNAMAQTEQEPMGLVEEGCNPCYNSSAHANNNWASTATNKYVATAGYNTHAPVKGNPIWQRAVAQKRVYSDADIAARNGALEVKGPTIFAQQEQGAEAENFAEVENTSEIEAGQQCNPCPNSAKALNSNWQPAPVPAQPALVQMSLI